MKKSLIAFAFVSILGASSYVVEGATADLPPCSGTWCTVYRVFGEDTFCCPTGTSCPNPDGASSECVAESS